jgi:hypothetical protein
LAKKLGDQDKAKELRDLQKADDKVEMLFEAEADLRRDARQFYRV